MKKLNTIVIFSLILSSGCSHSKNSPHQKPQTIITEQKLEDDKVLEKIPEEPENTHQIIEAKADDKEIEIKFGSTDIDEELPQQDKIAIPTDEKSFLKDKNTARMKFWVNYFLEKDRERFQRFINNGEEYRHHIEEILASYDLPKQLYYVGLIESGYYLGARSHAKAVGPWQFIAGTGKRYGLKISRELDERRDLFKATHAAAKYFRDLHNVFSSWELALSAYNAGEYGIMRRIMKYKTRDYYQLSKNKQLPSETINYVPKVLAAMHIISNAEKYGFNIPKGNQRIFDNTELHPVRKNVSLAAISKRLNVSVKLLRKLNPELKRNRIPRYFSGTYRLRVPLGLGPKLIAPFARESRKDIIRRTARSNTYHRVRRGESLTGIARRYDTSAGKLARLNGFRSWRTKLRVGQRLKVSGKIAASRKISARPIVYQVKPGDNLSTLADLFDIRVSDIKRANRLRRGTIYTGQKLVLPHTKKGIYTVKPGDHLTGIARKFNQPMAAILKLNKLNRKTIYPGQKIIVDID